MSTSDYRQIFADGLWHQNAGIVQLLGLCPLLAVTTSLINGLTLGLASTLVMLGASVSVSLARNHIPREIRRGLKHPFERRLIFAEHHESHAASAFYPSPFEEAAIMTLDGVGEWATASFGVGRGNRIELSHELRFPHSLGLLYSAFTYFTGFKVNSGEYKLMGLAPYGEPKYVDLILDRLLDLKADGSFRLDMRYFNYATGLTMTNSRFDELFGGPPRRPEAQITQREMDIARSIQAVTEEVVLKIARNVHRELGVDHLCLAGGVALNCVANGRLLREGPYEDIWIQPAAGDAGAQFRTGAAGTARPAAVARGAHDGLPSGACRPCAGRRRWRG
mgnify:CR=1 FL=1